MAEESQPEQRQGKNDGHGQARRRALQFCAVIAWLSLFAWIIGAFFRNRGGFSGIPHANITEFNRAIFPLTGLLAFLLVWTQIMLGSMRQWWQRLFPCILRWHKRIGIFVLLFALLHPLLLLSGIGWTAYFRQSFVAPAHVLWIWVGEVQLLLILVTALTALAARIPWLRRKWHALHMLNYAVFGLVWLHSWFLGADVAHTSLRLLWYFFAGTFLLAVTIRIIRSLNNCKTTLNETERNIV